MIVPDKQRPASARRLVRGQQLGRIYFKSFARICRNIAGRHRLINLASS